MWPLQLTGIKKASSRQKRFKAFCRIRLFETGVMFMVVFADTPAHTFTIIIYYDEQMFICQEENDIFYLQLKIYFRALLILH